MEHKFSVGDRVEVLRGEREYFGLPAGTAGTVEAINPKGFDGKGSFDVRGDNGLARFHKPEDLAPLMVTQDRKFLYPLRDGETVTVEVKDGAVHLHMTREVPYEEPAQDDEDLGECPVDVFSFPEPAPTFTLTREQAGIIAELLGRRTGADEQKIKVCPGLAYRVFDRCDDYARGDIIGASLSVAEVAMLRRILGRMVQGADPVFAALGDFLERHGYVRFYVWTDMASLIDADYLPPRKEPS